MPAPSTLKEFLDITYNPKRTAQRAKLFADWDPQEYMKLFAKADSLTTDSNIQQVVYGASVMSWLNYESNLWSLFPKRPAGPRTGWRVRIAGRSDSSGLQETAEIKATTKSTYILMYYQMKWMDQSFGASERVLWEAERDDSIDIWNEEREHAGKRHVQSIDEFLARPVNTVTQATWVIESIDRMISSAAEATFLVSSGGLTGATAADVYPYAGRYRRSGYAGANYGGAQFDAQVDENAGTTRSFTLKMLDDIINQVLFQGATREGLVILTGLDTAQTIADKLEAKQRFLDTARISKTLNGVTREVATGVEAGFEVASYRGIPILTSKAVQNNKPSGGISDIYGVHLPDTYISLGLPTLYLETGRQEWLLLDKLRRKAGFFTAAELVFTRFDTHFKIIDLSG